MEDHLNPADPRDIISTTYEDPDMAYIVDFDKYEDMLYSELEEELRDMTSEIVMDEDYDPEEFMGDEEEE